MNNLVAKHSRMKGGAGTHKSKKDYRRKGKHGGKAAYKRADFS